LFPVTKTENKYATFVGFKSHNSMNFIKKILFAVLVLMISSLIFLIVVNDHEIKNDLLGKTLESFGQQLYAMVPDGPEKEVLKVRFQEFINKAEQQEIPSDQIEQVAASILNITSHNKEVNAKQVLTELALDSVLQKTITRSPGKSGSPAMKRPRRLFSLPFFRRKEEKNTELAKRLREMYDFHKSLSRLKLNKKLPPSLYNGVIFMADSMMRVAMSEDFKKAIAEQSLQSLKMQIEMMEKEGLLTIGNEAKVQLKQLEETHKIAHQSLDSIGSMMDSTHRAMMDSINAKIRQKIKESVPQPPLEKDFRN